MPSQLGKTFGKYATPTRSISVIVFALSHLCCVQVQSVTLMLLKQGDPVEAKLVSRRPLVENNLRRNGKGDPLKLLPSPVTQCVYVFN